MTKSIDALILTNKADTFSQSVDTPQVQDIKQGLWMLHRDPEAYDEIGRHEIHSGELFISLGSIAHALCKNELPESDVVSDDNPLRGRYIRLLDDILPDHTDEPLLPDIPGSAYGLENVQVNGSLYTHDFLVAHPDLVDEFLSKNALANKIIANRRLNEDSPEALEPFNGRNASTLLHAALDDLDLISQAFKRFY